jgi:5-methylcytosine-specific restriction protein A
MEDEMSNTNGSKWIRPEKRLALYLRDSFRCVYCCADLHDASPADVTLDHVVPRADGGSHDASNLITCCRHCNSARQDKALARFAGPETRKDIKRLTARSMTRYMKLAKALIAGTTGTETT